MAFRNFPTATEAQLLQWLADAQADKAAGTTMTAWGNGGDSASKQVAGSPDKRIQEIYADLTVLNPTKYPANTRPTVTTAVFRDPIY